MFLERRTFIVKPDCMDEAIHLIKVEIERAHASMRLYMAVYGPFDVLLADNTAESQEAIEQGWADWGAWPETPKFMQQWYGVDAGGGTRELWQEHLGNPVVSARYVERRTFTVKTGHLDEVVKMIKAEGERPPLFTPARLGSGYLYTAVYGIFDTCLLDICADDPKAIDEWWHGWAALPSTPSYMEKWSSLVVSGKRELWKQK